MTKKTIIQGLLRILNSQWLNPTPCSYQFVGNVDAFTLSHLHSEESQRPGITVKTIIQEAEIFKICPMRSKEVTVIEGDSMREANIWDLQELKTLGQKSGEV